MPQKITEVQLSEIYDLRKQGMSCPAIAKQTGIHKETIRKYCAEKRIKFSKSYTKFLRHREHADADWNTLNLNQKVDLLRVSTTSKNILVFQAVFGFVMFICMTFGGMFFDFTRITSNFWYHIVGFAWLGVALFLAFCTIDFMKQYNYFNTKE